MTAVMDCAMYTVGSLEFNGTFNTGHVPDAACCFQENSASLSQAQLAIY